MLAKTFYFATQIFMEALTAKWSPHEFLQDFTKWLNALFKSMKSLLYLFANKGIRGRGVFRNVTSFLL